MTAYTYLVRRKKVRTVSGLIHTRTRLKQIATESTWFGLSLVGWITPSVVIEKVIPGDDEMLWRFSSFPSRLQ